MKKMNQNQPWFLYLLRCADGSLYTGISVNVERRLREHANGDGKGRGARSLRGKAPLSLVYCLELTSRSEALKLEYRVKQLTKLDKEQLVKRQPSADILRKTLLEE